MKPVTLPGMPLTTADLVYPAKIGSIETDYYSWRCPVCQCIPNVHYAARGAAELAATDHLGECPGQPIAPHRHITDNVHYPPYGTNDPATAPACYAIHKPGTPPGDPIDPADLVVVELYDVEQPTSAGVLLGDWAGTVDAATWTWLELQGYPGHDVDNPWLWANVVAADAWTPNNGPIAYRFAPGRFER